MGAGGEPLRLRYCRWGDCGAAFWICRCCDRGQRYCGDRCRQRARRQQRREANRRRHQSREGRLDHRDRQRAYRQRRRIRVTDTPSEAFLDSGSIAAAEPFRSGNGSESGSEEPGYAGCTRSETVCRSVDRPAVNRRNLTGQRLDDQRRRSADVECQNSVQFHFIRALIQENQEAAKPYHDSGDRPARPTLGQQFSFWPLTVSGRGCDGRFARMVGRLSGGGAGAGRDRHRRIRSVGRLSAIRCVSKA